MINPKLIHRLSTALQNAFQAAFSDHSTCPVSIEVSTCQHEQFGDYQSNLALKLAKHLKKSPQQIAEQLMQHLDGPDYQVTLAHPGFLNFTLDLQVYRHTAEQMAKHPTWYDQRSETVVIDYSSPNIAKPMHVGHLRSTVIGDTLANLHEYMGYPTVRISHIGDWGTSFGMLIAYIKQQQCEEALQQADTDILLQWYQAAKKAFDEDTDFRDRSRQEVVTLQQGDALTRRLWQTICQVSQQDFNTVYQQLHIKELTVQGESFYNDALPQVVADAEAKSLLTVSSGAKCMFLEGFNNREGEPLPLIIQKSDGGYNYATTDLAALDYRVRKLGAQKLLYVTDAGQKIHFDMIFAAAEKLSYLQNATASHIPFGLMQRQDGKKFKTREGATVKLMDLITASRNKAEKIVRERHPTWSEEDITTCADIIGIGAIKYADLSSHRKHDITFNLDAMLSFEGNTVVYILYGYARIASIEAKCPQKHPVDWGGVKHPSEIRLLKHCCRFFECLHQCQLHATPHLLCDYLYDLVTHFNQFFRDCRIIADPDEQVRLALASLCGRIIKEALAILGIRAHEQI